MRRLAGAYEQGLPGQAVYLIAVVALLSITVVSGSQTHVIAPLAAIATIVGLTHRRLLRWENLVGCLLVVMMFIPIGRYTIPGGLPFQLDPYRVLVALLLLAWASSLLIDPAVRVSRSQFDLPLLGLLFIALVSTAVNSGRITAPGASTIVAKRLTFFISFLLTYFVIVSLIRSMQHVRFLVKVLVTCSAVLGALALVEYVTGFNVFNHLRSVLPLSESPVPYSLGRRGDRLRVYGSSQHPIAYGALFAMMLPLTGYLWSATRERRWLACAGLIALGLVSTESRTAIIMAAAVLLVLLRLRARSIKRLWPALLPALVAIHFALPGSLGSLTSAFFPQGGLVAQQQSGAGTYGSGRLADWAPSIAAWKHRPLIGGGIGTRITDKGPLQNANILDDQWLTTLLETGIAGVIAWFWLFASFWRRLSFAARKDWTPRGWLCAALAADVTAFAVGMLTYDAFSFIQVTFVLFVLLALGAVALRDGPAGTTAT